MQADRLAETVSSSLPHVLMSPNTAHGDHSPTFLRHLDNTAHRMSTLRTEARVGESHGKDGHGRGGEGHSRGGLHRHESTAVQSWHQKQQISAYHCTLLIEVSAELKARIGAAMRLLSRTHEVYANQPANDAEDAYLFHALGHDKYKPQIGQRHGISALTSRQTTVRGRRRNEESPTHETIDSPLSTRKMIRKDSDKSTPFPTEIAQMHHQIPFLSGLGDIARNVGQTWSFDIMKVTRLTKDQSILTISMLLASPIAEKFPIAFDWQKWYAFIRVVQSEYGPSDKIPYHNRTHSSIHAHATSVLLSWLKHADKYDHTSAHTLTGRVHLARTASI